MRRQRNKKNSTKLQKANSPPEVSKTSSNALSRIAEPTDTTELSVEKRTQALVNHTQFEGPLPPPEIFRKYGEIIPDAPERILRVFEEDSTHARDIQIRALEAQVQDNRRVHWMAWTLIIFGFVLSAFFAWIDKDILAGTLLASTLAGTITGFLQNKKDK